VFMPSHQPYLNTLLMPILLAGLLWSSIGIPLASAQNINQPFRSSLKFANSAATKAGLVVSKDMIAILKSIIGYLTGLISILSVAALLYAGYLYITSAGDEKKAGVAKQIVLFVVIGLAVVILAAIIVNTVLTELAKP
jgi:hypothetical protein